MRTVAAPSAVSAPTDPRMEAFCAKSAVEVFHSIATPTEIWRADPYDVEAINPPSREAFEHLLNRASRVPPPPGGAVLVTLGEAGSGKTHLMRAFRTRSHSQNLGYCSYMQMATEVGSYPRYMLQNLIDGLELPYAPEGVSRTGLARLSSSLLEMVPRLDASAATAFREGEGDPAALVEDFADRLKTLTRFRDCDLNLLRVMLHLQREDPRVRARALMWLRCEEMTPRDRDWIGGLPARTDESHPLELLRQLARLCDAVHGVPLVILIDQLEDIANLSAPIERFRKVVDAITTFTDQVANAVVVMACLEDYFKTNVEQLIASKRDRLLRDPEPIRLGNTRTLDEIHAMIARRLAHLYATAEVDFDPANDLFPFREEHLPPLQPLKTRDILDVFRRHHQKCIHDREWSEPVFRQEAGKTVGTGTSEVEPLPRTDELDSLWNDFHSSFQAQISDEENELAGVLAKAIRNCSDELQQGYHFGDPQPTGAYVEVETHRPNNAVDKLLVSLCNGKAGAALLKQLAAVENRLGEFPAALVRSIEFPKSGKSLAPISAILKKDGRRVVVENAEWRRMHAFEAFAQQHRSRPDFTTWQQSARPLGQLRSLQDILRLKNLTAVSSTAPPVPPDTPVPSPAPAAATLLPEPPRMEGVRLRLGFTMGRLPEPVLVDPQDLTRHACFLGGSGSGKTTAALNLLEQLLAQGIPAILVDRKGDLCRYADTEAWTRPLGDVVREAERQALRDRLDIALYTPGDQGSLEVGRLRCRCFLPISPNFPRRTASNSHSTPPRPSAA